MVGLSGNDKRKLLVLAIGQLFSSILDLIAVAFIGLTAALAASGIAINSPNGTLIRITTILRIDELSIQKQVIFLSSIAVLLFVLRTVLSILITKTTLKLLFECGASHADELLQKVLNSQYDTIKKVEINKIRFALTRGSQSLYVGFLGGILSLIGDISIVAILGLALVLIDLKTALISIIFFSFVGLILHFQTHSKVIKYAARETEIDVDTSQGITDLLTNYKFLVPRGGMDSLRLSLKNRRLLLSKYVSELTFLPSFSKYYIESALIIGAVLLSGFQFLTKDSGSAITSLGIFLAAGSRISPAVLRVQQSIMSINRSISAASTALDLNSLLIPKIEDTSYMPVIRDEMVGEIEFRSVSYRFPDSNIDVLSNISIKIVEGEHIAIIGQSGAGKTTFLNLMLGIATPTSGEILISGIEPSDLFKSFPGKIAYVPQETNLINGSIRENLLFGIEDWEIEESILWDSLRKANLEDFVRGIPLSLDHPVGELGNALSGGQRQRLVLARALVTGPKILVLDEATSAIDLETENSIANELVKLKHSMTIVSIAHKRESVAMADKVYRLQNTHLEFMRTFSA